MQKLCNSSLGIGNRLPETTTHISIKVHSWPATTSLLALWSLFLLSVDCQELACLGTSQVLTDRLCPGWVGIGQAWFWAIAPHLTSPRSPDPRDISPGTTLWSTNKSRKFHPSTFSLFKLVGLWGTHHMWY